jgi:hypothetical protein
VGHCGRRKVELFDCGRLKALLSISSHIHAGEMPSSSCDVHEPLKHKRQALISGMSRLRAIAGLAVLAWGLLLGRNLFPARVPAWFNETVTSGPWINAVGSAFESNGRMSYGV